MSWGQAEWGNRTVRTDHVLSQTEKIDIFIFSRLALSPQCAAAPTHVQECDCYMQRLARPKPRCSRKADRQMVIESHKHAHNSDSFLSFDRWNWWGKKTHTHRELWIQSVKGSWKRFSQWGRGTNRAVMCNNRTQWARGGRWMMFSSQEAAFVINSPPQLS